MTSTENKLKQIVTIVITSSILIITFTFILWTSHIEKKENNINFHNKLEETKNIINGLVEVKKMKMKALADTIATSPVLRGAVSTDHKGTINDVLNTIKEKNNLNFALLIKDKKIQYSDNETLKRDIGIKDLSSAKFLGATKINDFIFLISSSLKKEELDQWSNITGAKFILNDKNNQIIIRNYPHDEVKSDGSPLSFSKNSKYLIGGLKELKETMTINFYISIEHMKRSFERKRNKYLLLGGVLTFFGFVIGIIISSIISKMMKDQSGTSNKTIDDLFKQIDLLKEKLN